MSQYKSCGVCPSSIILWMYALCKTYACRYRIWGSVSTDEGDSKIVFWNIDLCLRMELNTWNWTCSIMLYCQQKPNCELCIIFPSHIGFSFSMIFSNTLNNIWSKLILTSTVFCRFRDYYQFVSLSIGWKRIWCWWLSLYLYLFLG